MTSQDGIPIPGPCTFLCPCSAVIVYWKPSTCSESWVGAFRQTIVAERICDGEEDISNCCMEARVLWDVTYNPCSSFCSGVERDGLREGDNK